MENKTNIAQELNDLHINLPVCPMPASMQVPPAYFTHLADNILAQIKLEDTIQDLPKTNPFEVPTGYFEEFESNLSSLLALESLPKSMPYQVPDNYFEQLSEQVISNIPIEKPVLKPLRGTNHTFAYLSMAATILLFVGLSFIFLSQKNTPSVEQQLSMMPDTEVNNYIKNHQNEFETDVVLDVLDESHIDLNSLEAEIIDKQLNNLSDEEIASFIL